MNKNFRITILGSGNVAEHLGKAFFNAGHNIHQIYSRNPITAKELALVLNAIYINSVEDIDAEADIYIFCVKDSAIVDIVNKFPIKNKLLVHTSGSVEMDIFKSKTSNQGVFYPLQSFVKGKDVDFNNIPICLEYSNEESLKILELLAYSLSKNIYKINSEQRLILHIAAVFVCNFTNYMYAVAEELTKQYEIPYELLLPLIEETAQRVKHISPSKAQTGPAVRNDINIISKHEQTLQQNADFLELYRIITKQIKTRHIK